MKLELAMVLGIIYTAVMVPAISYLLYKGKLRKELGWVLLVISALLGFAYFAPMFPWQLQLLMLGKLPQANLPMVALVTSIVILSSLLVGRVFCGYVCPPGALQELAYLAPIKKIKVPSSITVKVRLVVFVAMLVLAVVFSFNLTKVLGLPAFFQLILGPGLVIFLAIIISSTVVYRPFCRFVCPFGALSSLLSWMSVYGVRRNSNCVDCGRCEKVCPPQVLKGRAGSECYLCGRCLATCHKDALKYSKVEVKK
ncbi:MAG TPA: 4Fe-4S binding protein [Methanomassiliicoccales archaeon]|nr:4Fe-4S binding protein [Methanomassiliicoccales archaeon]HPR99028.1 4Fe-4S binding protein [Methanomassiliicoccales archaeon]